MKHVGDGKFKAILQINPEDAKEKHAAFDLSTSIVERTLTLSGIVTGERGVGLEKIPNMAAKHGMGWDGMGQTKKRYTH